MRALGISDFKEYNEFLKKNPEEISKLLPTLTINLSYFFRNPETFDFLRQKIFPEFQRKEKVVLWSAGCAQGEEAYSLGIIAAETHLLDRVTIYGTDIDPEALNKAKEGIYLPSALQYAEDSLLKKYFTKKDGNYQICESLRSLVKFYLLDLFATPPFENCDLIMCRNVLIYLRKEAQSTLLHKFFNLLKPDGYLVIGKVELLLGIPEAGLFETVSQSEHIYQKRGRNF